MVGKDIIPFVAFGTPSPRPRDFMEEYFAEAFREEVHLVTMVPGVKPWSTPRNRVSRNARGWSADHYLRLFGPRLLVAISLTLEDVRHGGPAGGTI